MLRVFAPAKINLCLHVTGRRSDGYHLLDTVVGFADVGDWLTLSVGQGAQITVTGPHSGALNAHENIISRCLAQFGAQDVHVTLEKNLPLASGIGGGSSDAAAAYRGLLALRGRAPMPQDHALLLGLGADVPMCAAARAARVQGIGESISPLPDLAILHAVLVNPRIHLATPLVFSALHQKENPTLHIPAQGLNDAPALIDWLAVQRNDLQAAAISLAPEIAAVLGAITQTGAGLARMSGSGATCFGLYGTRRLAARASAALRKAHPDWWIAPCTINGALDVNPQVMRATT